jgi:histone deacetylase 1/2
VCFPHTSQHNGIAERKHRHLVETGLALLAHSSLPLRYWDEAFLTACYLINRMPTPVLHKDTPFHRLLGVQPDYTFLRTFGCACWPSLHKYNARKLAFRSTMCVFLGYSPMHKGYKCLDRSTGRIYISRDVIFEKSVFPYSTPGVVIDVSTLAHAIASPSDEPVTSVNMRNYDLSYLSPNAPVCVSSPLVQVPPAIDVAAPAGVIDVHGCTPPEPCTPTGPSSPDPPSPSL